MNDSAILYGTTKDPKEAKKKKILRKNKAEDLTLISKYATKC